MNWSIKFIGEEQFKTHVAKTIAEYAIIFSHMT